MKTPPEKASAVQSPFDEWTKAVAQGLTRRKTLQLIGGTFTGALLALRGPKAWAAPSTGCGHICAPLFHPGNQTAFESCTNACEDCYSCNGSPTMTSTQTLVCNNATPCRNAGGLACCQTQNGQPVQNCCAGVCCTGDCCAGTCLPACPAGQVREPQSCTCVYPPGPDQLACFCPDGTEIDLCSSCYSDPRQAPSICPAVCASHGGSPNGYLVFNCYVNLCAA